MRDIPFTHYGWFGICPVIFSGFSEEEMMREDRSMFSESTPVIDVRWTILLPLLFISEVVIDLCMITRARLDRDYQPTFPMHVSGRLQKTIYRKG